MNGGRHAEMKKLKITFSKDDFRHASRQLSCFDAKKSSGNVKKIVFGKNHVFGMHNLWV